MGSETIHSTIDALEKILFDLRNDADCQVRVYRNVVYGHLDIPHPDSARAHLYVEVLAKELLADGCPPLALLAHSEGGF